MRFDSMKSIVVALWINWHIVWIELRLHRFDCVPHTQYIREKIRLNVCAYVHVSHKIAFILIKYGFNCIILFGYRGPMKFDENFKSRFFLTNQTKN